MNKSVFGLLGLVGGITLGAFGATYGPVLLQHASQSTQPYAGQEKRIVSSLSADDIAALEKGEGWGLAKPAEFNGYPGPAHVLEFADKLALDEAQCAAIEDAFNAMNGKARDLGVALIDAEEALDGAFKDKEITPDLLEERLKVAESLRAALRNVHLAAHLEVTPLLTDAQKTQYAALRGYGNGHSGHEGH